MTCVSIFDRNGGKLEDFPATLPHNVADHVVFVQALHNNDDAAGHLAVQAAVKRMLIPLVHRIASRIRHGLLGFQRIVNDDEVTTTPRQDAPHRCCHPEPCVSVINSETAWR